MSTIHQVFKNLGGGVLPQLLNLLSNFILPGMIVVMYGSSVNGLISSIRVIIGYVSLVGAGIAIATTQALYKPVARKDYTTIRGMVKATQSMFNKCGYVYLVAIFGISFLYPFFIKTSIPYLTTVLLLIIMSISGASEFFVVGKCRSLLYAHQKVYVSSIIQAVSLGISLILAVLMIKLHASIIAVQLAISGVYIVRAFFLNVYVRKNYTDCLPDAATVPIKQATAKRKDAFVHQLAGLVVTGSQALILSIMVGLEAASVFTIYNIVFIGIQSICMNLNSSVTPFIGRTFSLGDKDKIRSQYRLLDFSFYILSFIIFSVATVTLIPFINIYTRGADINYIYENFGFLFILLQIFNIHRLPGVALINVAGHFMETRNRAIIEAVLSVTCSIVFTYFFGMYGVLLGSIVAIGWRCIDIIVYAHRHLLFQSYRNALIRILRVIVYVSIIFFTIKYPYSLVDSYGKWILVAVCALGCAVILLGIDILIFERPALRNLLSIIQKKKTSR